MPNVGDTERAIKPQFVDAKITESRNQDNTGDEIDRSLLRTIDPMTIPVSFIVWTYVRMCEELQCALHMRGPTRDIFKWWIVEALQYTPRYQTAVQAYYRMVPTSSMVQTNSGAYQVHDIIHVRDLLLFTAVMYSMDLIDQDSMWSMDWSRAWSSSDLTGIPAYIFNAYE